MQQGDGFTLVELMITIAIIGVLAAIASPGFFQFVQSQRATSAANDFVASLNLARNEAIKRGIPVAVCASNDPQAATPACSGNDNWEDGWIVFTDDGPNNGVFDGGETLLRVGRDIPEAQLNTNNTTPFVRFQGSGIPSQRDDFTLVPQGTPGNDENRDIELSATGRAEVQLPERYN